MKNQLLITTALVGGLAVSGVANAEITGSMKFGYAVSEGVSNDATAAGTQGFNKETQIDMSTSGELSNGWGFTAGASFEAENTFTDNSSTTRTDIDGNEGVFIEFKLPSETRLHIGQDKFNNMDDSATPTTGSALQTVMDMQATAYKRDLSSPYGSFGIGLAQPTPFGEVSLLYVPQNGDKGTTGDHTAKDIDGKAAYEVKFKGNLGVEGLTVVAGMNERKLDLDGTAQGTRRDGEASSIGAAYNFGSVAVGFQTHEDDLETGVTREGQEYGVTFAVSDAVSIGLAKTTMESSDKTFDEEATIATVGYNLGPIALELNYADVENANFASDGADFTGFSVATSVKF